MPVLILAVIIVPLLDVWFAHGSPFATLLGLCVFVGLFFGRSKMLAAYLILIALEAALGTLNDMGLERWVVATCVTFDFHNLPNCNRGDTNCGTRLTHLGYQFNFGIGYLGNNQVYYCDYFHCKTYNATTDEFAIYDNSD